MFSHYVLYLLLLLLLLLIPSLGNAEILGRDQRACNNSPELCAKPYDEVMYLGAHDSPFRRDSTTSFSSFGNQFFNTTTQLDAGVRLLSAQIHLASNTVTKQREIHVCHTTCALFDAGPLKDWLFHIREWMDSNPNDIVTLILVNMNNIDARELEGIYSQADISRYGYVPPNINKAPPPSNEFTKTWPTLNDMITLNTRLVTFVNPIYPDQANAPYLLNEFDFLWENDYEVTDPSGFMCYPGRPENKTINEMRESGRLFMMNHMLCWQQAFGIQVPDIRNVHDTNGWDGRGALGAHVLDCGNQITRLPTFVLVDFFNVGPAMKTVDIFNHVDKPVGRLNVIDQIVGGGPGVELFQGSAITETPSWIWVLLTAMIIIWYLIV